MPLFDGLTASELAHIEPQLQPRGYRAGEPIYRRGENAHSIFVLASGAAKLLRASLHGHDVVMNVLAPGEAFGSLAVLGQPTYTDTAQALTVSCAMAIPADVFRDLIERHPRLALTVLDEFLHDHEDSQVRIQRLSVDTAHQRIAAALLTLAEKFGDPRREPRALVLPLTRADLAALTGTTPETVSRVVSSLRDDGIVETGRRWTTVLDRPRLASVARG